jgi:diacylglycerol kinase (ATP)
LEKIAFIINPAAGKSNQKQIRKWILEVIDPRKFETQIVESTKPGDATELAAERIARGCGIIAAVGGDGTVNEVARAVVHTEALLAIIPTGSGNGLARHLKIPTSPREAIRLINPLKWRIMDYAMVNNIPFFCTSGVGFDARVGNTFAGYEKRGLFTYVKIVLSEFYKYTPHRYTIEMNGRRLEREAFLITIANASQYGNNAYIAPGAEVDDGSLDLCIISKFPRYKVWELGVRMVTGKLPSSRFYEVFKVKETKVSSENQTFLHYDGEAGGSVNNIEVRIVPKGLRVMVPSEDPGIDV